MRSIVALAALLMPLGLAHGQAGGPPGFRTRPMLDPSAGQLGHLEITPVSPAAPFRGPLPVGENLLTFDDRLAEVQWNDGRWQLWASGILLKDFGRHEADARQALRLVHELRLTQLGSVGTPRPVMEYWLAEGQAPRGMVPGLRTTPIDQGSLRAEAMQGCWCVRDAAHVLLNFGTHQDEAEQAVAVMRRYGFESAVAVGQGVPSMLVFLGPQSGMRATPQHAPPPPPGRIVGGREMLTPTLRAAGQPEARLGRPADIRSPGSPGKTDPLGQLAAVPGRQLAPPGLPLTADLPLIERVPLDARQARLVQEGGNWKLLCGNYVIANFGASEADARRGEVLVHAYRFTEQCLVGRPQPVFSYFLVNGEAPHGLALGLNGVSFQPDNLQVLKVGDDWTICDQGALLLPFGDREQEAKQALLAIQKHRFDTICRIGAPDSPAMTILLRRR